MSIQKKIQLSLLGTTLTAVLVATFLLFFFIRDKLETDLGHDLLKVAALTAPHIPGDAHETIRANEDAATQEFQTIRDKLMTVRNAVNLPAEQIYTIRPRDEGMEFVVMTQERPFVGDRLERNETIEWVLNNKQPAFTGIYPTVTGRWISAFAPIHNENAEVVALLEVDFPYDKFQSEFYYSIRPVAVGALLMFLALFLASRLIAERVAGPLRKIAARVEPFADGQGDLTIQMNLTGKDEIAAVGGHIDSFVASLAATIREVKRFSDSVLKSAESFRETASRARENGQSSAAMIETTTAANEELVVSLQEISRNIKSQDQLISETRPTLERLLKFVIDTEDSAGNMNRELKSAAKELQAGRDIMQSLSEQIDRMQDSSEQIESVVEVIQNIADRIAMLALNASIEAARAGEQGRGFAVVAEEISKLSEGTTRQIKDIARIAAMNRDEASRAVTGAEQSAVMYDAVFDVLLGSEEQSERNMSSAASQRGYAESGLSSLQSLASFSERNTRALGEQVQGTREVESSIVDLGAMGEQLARLTMEIGETASRMETEAENLDAVLSRLKV
ncbi:MAG: methyl-accepting chemotaxis protein [bacterium]|nr:methyl-accepting chemotaxis protein [bacterium]